MIRNTETHYGLVSKALHWLIALGVIGLLVMGIFMEEIADKPLRFQVYGIHKALGITLLALMVLRLVWKLMHWGLPTHNPNHKPWEQKLAAAVHWAFYGLLIAMPLSGWLMTGAAGSTLSWFGFFNIPNLVEADKDMRHFYGEVHEIIANLIWLFLALHVGGAVKHAVIDKDGTLRRMAALLVFACFVPVAAYAEDRAAATVWKLERDQSRLTIEATQEGGVFKGVFNAFSGAIRFSPDKPEIGDAQIMIDLGSFNSGNAERDETVMEKDWFDTATTPTSFYHIDRFEKGSEDGSFIAKGRLVLRGIERPLNLPFKLLVTNDGEIQTAHATGEVSINRLEYGVGEGDWANPSMVGTDVKIMVDIFATALLPED